MALCAEEQGLQCLGGVHDALGAMGGEKLRVPEAPAHREAGQPGVGGGLDVHIGVAHIDGPAGSGAQLLQNTVSGAGLRATPWDSPMATGMRVPK